MRNVGVKTHLVLAALAAGFLLTGCTDWKKKYDGLAVEHQNLKGLYELCQSELDGAANERTRLSHTLNATQQQLAELQRQMQEGGKGPFGDLRPLNIDWLGHHYVTVDNTSSSPRASRLKSAVQRRTRPDASVPATYLDKDVSVVGHTDTDPSTRPRQWRTTGNFRRKSAVGA